MSDPPQQVVLIAEDDSSIRRLLAVSLQRFGYETVEACDGNEALAAMLVGGIDLLLLDLMMPNTTGWEVVAARNAHPQLRLIPVIVVSAERGEDVGKTLPGISAFLPKPFNLDALRALVTLALHAPHER